MVGRGDFDWAGARQDRILELKNSYREGWELGMAGMGLVYGMAIPEAIWIEIMLEKSRKKSNFAWNWSRKIARNWESKNSKQIDYSGLDYDAAGGG